MGETVDQKKWLAETLDFLSFKIHKIKVSRDDRGEKGWLLEKMTIDNAEPGEHYVFNCNHWLVTSDPAEEFQPGQSKIQRSLGSTLHESLHTVLYRTHTAYSGN